MTNPHEEARDTRGGHDTVVSLRTPDGGAPVNDTRLHYGWKMVAAAAGILAVNSQPFYAFGLYLKTMTREFNWERGAMSLALSLALLVANPLGILAGRLSDKYGPRLLLTAAGIINGIGFLLLSQISEMWQLYLLFGVVIAVGNSLTLVPLTSTIARWFVKRRGTALGLTWAGMAFGGVIGPAIAQWTISNHGWPWAFAVLGIMTLAAYLPLAQLLKRRPEDAGMAPYGATPNANGESSVLDSSGMTYGQALHTGRFWLFGATLMCQYFIGQTVFSQLAAHIGDVGLTEATGAAVLSAYAAVSLIGINLSGVISDRIGVKRTMLAGFCCIIAILVWLYFSTDAWMFYVFAVLWGLVFGTMIPMQTAAPGELFGLKALGMISASAMFMGAIGGAVGPPLAGAIYDSRGSYGAAFLLAIGVCAVAVALSVVLLRTGNPRRTR